MIRAALALGAAVLIAACDSGPNVGAHVGFDSGGLTVSPTVSGRVGGLGVAVSP